MSRGMCFSYGGFHFIPVRQFEKDEGDFFGQRAGRLGLGRALAPAGGFDPCSH